MASNKVQGSKFEKCFEEYVTKSRAANARVGDQQATANTSLLEDVPLLPRPNPILLDKLPERAKQRQERERAEAAKKKTQEDENDGDSDEEENEEDTLPELEELHEDSEFSIKRAMAYLKATHPEIKGPRGVKFIARQCKLDVAPIAKRINNSEPATGQTCEDVIVALAQEDCTYGPCVMILPASTADQWMDEIVEHIEASELPTLLVSEAPASAYDCLGYKLILATYGVCLKEACKMNDFRDGIQRLRDDESDEVPKRPDLQVFSGILLLPYGGRVGASHRRI